MRIAAFLFLLLAIANCSTAEKVVATPESAKWDASFEEGRKLLEAKSWQKALNLFENLASKDPNSPRYYDLLLATGEAYAGLGEWKSASESYHQATALASQKNDRRGEAEAMFRTALAAEALEDDLREVSLLRDLLSRKDAMTEERGKVEVPARLAAAYARMGVEGPANKFFKEAEKELARLEHLRAANTLAPDWLAKLLFEMGALSLRPITNENYESTLRPVARAQGYLLRASSLGNADWSAKASQQLIKTYRQAYALIEAVPLPKEKDTVLARKMQDDQRRKMVEPLSDILDGVTKFRPPSEEAPNAYVKEVFQAAKEINDKLSNLRLAIPPHKKLTPEASEREGLKREGRPANE